MRSSRTVVLSLLVLALTAFSLSAQSLRSMIIPKEDTKKDSAGQKVPVPRKDFGGYQVFADGNLKDVLGKKEGASAPSGSLGVSITRPRIAASFLINAVGTASPLEKDFGTSLLAPAAGNGLSAGLAELRYFFLRTLDGICSGNGIRLYGSVSSSRWKRSAADSTHVGAVIPGGGAGVFCGFVNHFEPAELDSSGKQKKEERTIAVAFDIGLALRAIAGDVAHSANDTLRTRILSTAERAFWGIEAGLSIQYNGLKAGLTYYRFKGEIPGFSRGQVVAGFSVETALAKGLFEK